MRTVDETILFLIRNATPDDFYPVEVSECDLEGIEKDDMVARRHVALRTLLLNLSGPTRYTVPLNIFEAFVGESFSFEKHLRAVHEEGSIKFGVAAPGSYYDSPKYRICFDHTNGLTKNYKIGKSFVTFHIRTNRDAFLGQFKKIMAHAIALELFETEN